MQSTIKNIISIGVLFSLSAIIFANDAPPSTQAESKKLNIANLSWSKLRYTASKMFISFNTDVEASILDNAQTNALLIDTDKTGERLLTASDQNLKISMHSSFLGQTANIDFIMNDQGTALQRSSLNTGSRLRYRRFRYLPGGAWSIKRYPKEKERDLPWQQWSQKTIDRYHVNVADNAQMSLSEAEALFYFASVVPFEKKGDHFTTYMFDDNNAIKLDMTAEYAKQLFVDFDVHSKGHSENIDRKIEVIKVRVKATPYPASDQKADFSFLGYKGDIDLYIDPKRHIIVELAGKADHVGDIHIRLQEVTLR